MSFCEDGGNAAHSEDMHAYRIAFLSFPNAVARVRWAERLARRGHDVGYFSLSRSNLPPDSRVSYHPLALPPLKGYARFFFGRSRTEAALKEFRPDIVHGFYTTNYGYLAAMQRIAPSVVTITGSDLLLEPKRSPFFRWINGRVSRKADALNPVSAHLAELLQSQYSVPAGKVHQFPAGIDTGLFRPGNRNEEGPFLIVSTRNFEPVYNLGLLVGIVPELLKAFPDVRFEFFGSGSLEQKYRSQLAPYDRVRFGGWQPAEVLAQRLGEAHIYVSTSLSDGTSSSLLEAMACGAFPVVMDLPSNREWIRDGENGFLIPNDPSALKSRLIGALRDRELRRRAGQINRKLVLERADLDRMVGRLEKLYSEIIG